MQTETGCGQWWPSVIGEGATHSGTIALDDLAGCIVLVFDLTFNRTHAAYALFQLFLGMTVCFVDRTSRFAEIVKMTQPMDAFRQCLGDGFANGVLSIAHHGRDRHRQGGFDFRQQGSQLIAFRRQ